MLFFLLPKCFYTIMAPAIKNQLLEELAYEISHTRILRSHAKEILTFADVIKYEQELNSWTQRINPLIDKIYSNQPNFEFIFKEFEKARQSFQDAGIVSMDQFKDIDHFIHKKRLRFRYNLGVLSATLKFGSQMVRAHF